MSSQPDGNRPPESGTDAESERENRPNRPMTAEEIKRLEAETNKLVAGMKQIKVTTKPTTKPTGEADPTVDDLVNLGNEPGQNQAAQNKKAQNKKAQNKKAAKPSAQQKKAAKPSVQLPPEDGSDAEEESDASDSGMSVESAFTDIGEYSAPVTLSAARSRRARAAAAAQGYAIKRSKTAKKKVGDTRIAVGPARLRTLMRLSTSDLYKHSKPLCDTVTGVFGMELPHESRVRLKDSLDQLMQACGVDDLAELVTLVDDAEKVRSHAVCMMKAAISYVCQAHVRAELEEEQLAEDTRVLEARFRAAKRSFPGADADDSGRRKQRRH